MKRLTDRTALVLAMGLGAVGAVVALRASVPPAVHAAPAPFAPADYRFVPVNPSWQREVSLLESLDEGVDPPDQLWRLPKGSVRDPDNPDQFTDRSYSEMGKEAKVCKIFRYYPSGRLYQEIDNAGEHQHWRTLHPDGAPAGYIHRRAGKWLNGHGVSPDGKVRHALVRGKGEIVSYGREAGNRRHEWYIRGELFLEKLYQGGRCVRAWLHGPETMFLGTPSEERLYLLSKEVRTVWVNGKGKMPYGTKLPSDEELPVFPERRLRLLETANMEKVGAIDETADDPGDRQQTTIQEYEKVRAVFMKKYERMLKANGYDGEKLGIAFLCAGQRWPDKKSGR